MLDGFVKSPSAAFRFMPALLNSRYARRRSRFNRVNHCDVLKVRLIPKHCVWRLEKRCAPCTWSFLLCRLFSEVLRDNYA